MEGLRHKIGIVTGAATGVGKGIAGRFAKEGVHVIGVDILPQVDKVFKEIKANYQKNQGFSMRVDVRKNDDVEKMTEAVIEKFGRIDILVNNAAINDVIKPVVDLSEEDFDNIIDTNLKGVFLCDRAVAREMIKQRGGKIINIGSMASKTGAAYFAAYCSSKGAVLIFTQSLALELAPYNINVNCVCPGNVDTPMHWNCSVELAKINKQNLSLEEIARMEELQRPLRRIGQPKDIAGLVAFLCSKDAEYMTGQGINISGGMEFH